MNIEILENYNSSKVSLIPILFLILLFVCLFFCLFVSFFIHFFNFFVLVLLLGSPPTIIESIPHYLTETQKSKVSSIINPKEGRPKKWKQTTKQRQIEERNIERFNHRKVLLQHLKTVIVAQDRLLLYLFLFVSISLPVSLTLFLHPSRTGLNQALLSADLQSDEIIDSNIEKQFYNKMRTAYNIENWKLFDAIHIIT